METKQIQFDRIRDLESGQFVLECNVNAEKEVQKLLCVRCDVYDVRAVVGSKQIAVSGKVGVKIVYQVEDGAESADYVTEFSKLLADDSVGENTKVIVRAAIADTETELRGQSVAIRTVVSLSPIAVNPVSVDVFIAEDGVCAKRCDVELTRLFAEIDREIAVSDRYSTGVSVDKILCYSASAVVCKQSASEQGLTIDGEICAHVTYYAEGEVSQKSFSIPFSETVQAPEGASALVTATIGAQSLTVGGKDGDNVLALDVTASLTGFVFVSESEQVVTDVYAPCYDLEFSSPCLSFDAIADATAHRERIVGSVDIAEGEQDAARVLCCEVAENELVSAAAADGAIVTEGSLTACVVYEGEDGAKSSLKVELPYALTHEARAVREGDSVLACVGCCDMFAKIKRGREIEVGATLAFASDVVRTQKLPVVTELTVGEKLSDSGEAIVVVGARKGETSWDVAKRLKVTQAEVEEGNPSVSFPAEGGEKIVVYRMLAV